MDLDFENLAALRTLLEVDGLGPSKILNLVSKFGSPQNVFNADQRSITGVNLISTILAQRIKNASVLLDEGRKKLSDELTMLKKRNFKLLTYYDKAYPELLKNIYSPPIIIYIWGEITEKDKTSIAIVGTRMPTGYGKQQAEKFGGELAENGITITSGLARGIDSVSHKAALKHGGRTIAVIGSGLDRIYPPENKKLAEEIAQNGAVISEFSLGTKPDASNFPRRNRIIAGLTLGTIIVESNTNGGAMQTAALALDQNREVFAIPGNLDTEQSRGTNSLIKKGEAKLITNTEDVLVELDLKLKPVVGKNIPKPSEELNIFESKIFDQLSREPKHIDTIARESNLSTSDCLINLLSMEFKGLVKQLPGKQFIASN